jgi:hypothetical protein
MKTDDKVDGGGKQPALDLGTEEVEGHATLKMLFTPAEQQENAQALARVWPEIARLEDEKKSVVSQFKSQIEALQADANRFSGYVRDGFHFTQVSIVTRRDYRRGVFEQIRTDTGEVYNSRTLTAAERQQALPLVEKR